jgi:hypothetical protein
LAQVSISSWDASKGRNHAGIIKVLRDYCGVDFDTAHSMSLKLIRGGATYYLDVPFAKRAAFIQEAINRGFSAT